MGDYKLDVEMAVSGDRDARDRLKTLEKYIEQTRARAAALNRLKISPAVAVDDRISAPLRSVRAELERAGSLYTRVFRNAGTGVGESIKPVLYSISDWFDFCRSKVDWWKNSLIRAGRVAAERVLSEFQRAYAKIRKMFLDNLNLQLDVAGKLLVEHKVVAFINNLDSGGSGTGESKKESFGEMVQKNFIDKAAGFPSDYMFKKLEDYLDGNDVNVGQDKSQDFSDTGIESRKKGMGRGKLGGYLSSRIDEYKAGYALSRESGAGKLKSIIKATDVIGETTSGKAGNLFARSRTFFNRVPLLNTVIGAAEILSSDDKLKTGAEVGGRTVGALAGAKMGAVVGTFFAPGIGTAIGGALGGIIGGIGGQIAAGKAVDRARGNTSSISGPEEVYIAPPQATNAVEGNSNQNSITQNLTLNVTVDSDMSRTELARFVAERIAAEVRKITQNTTSNPAIAGGGV
jgi:hypothetical protein